MLQQLELIRKPHWTSKHQRPGQVTNSIIIFFFFFFYFYGIRLRNILEINSYNEILYFSFKVRPSLLLNLPLVLLVFQLAT